MEPRLNLNHTKPY